MAIHDDARHRLAEAKRELGGGEEISDLAAAMWIIMNQRGWNEEGDKMVYREFMPSQLTNLGVPSDTDRRTMQDAINEVLLLRGIPKGVIETVPAFRVSSVAVTESFESPWASNLRVLRTLFDRALNGPERRMQL